MNRDQEYAESIIVMRGALIGMAIGLSVWVVLFVLFLWLI